MLRLLIVDDESIIRDSIAEITIWEKIGYQLCGVCKNGLEALDFIYDKYPDVVITDLKMPVLNGLELIERALKLDKHIQFIILSGFGEFEYAKEAMKYGVKHYLLKPTNKDQIIEALLEIKKDFEKKQRNALTSQVQFLLQKTFYIELFTTPKHTDQVLTKYKTLLGLPESRLSYGICSFLDDHSMILFLQKVFNLEKEISTGLITPILYLRNVAILLFPSNIDNNILRFVNKIKEIQFPNQSITPEVQLLEADNLLTLYQGLIPRILRYSEITLCHPTLGISTINNNTFIPVQIEILAIALSEAATSDDIIRLLDDAFHPLTNTTTITAFASSLYLKLIERIEPFTPEKISTFFEDLTKCTSVSRTKEVTYSRVLSLLSKNPEIGNNINSIINQLKDHVRHNLSSGELSLKNLAENHFYISVGYLSKQFIKIEGERFSDYLNRERMEMAKNLLSKQSNTNIKDIAEEVGFGSNPRYFSQVFKKYTGVTPSEYIDEMDHPHSGSGIN